MTERELAGRLCAPLLPHFFLDLAASGLRMPIAADLVLHERPDAEHVAGDGVRLGQVMEATARRYRTPLALSLMDLRLEKRELLRLIGLEDGDVDTFHFAAPPQESQLDRARASLEMPFSRRNQAHLDALRYIATQTDLTPVGMSIGPFSLMTKLMGDPITAIAMAGIGVAAGDDPAVLTAERCLALAEIAIARSLWAQAEAGAQAVMICEPAANRVYLSPRQIEAGSDIFERFVMQPNLRLRRVLVETGMNLIFHDCGELTDFMIGEFARRLNPSVLSLGSSRKLWEDSRLVPREVVLFGNLPTKSFYSDASMPDETVVRLARELLARMRETAHPFILGSECDVLHVPEDTAIRRKVDLMLEVTAAVSPV